ncbi:MAG: ABC transporter permease [Gemmatimonadetes bacterium]|nr:ABC transporter permease [Gemmatimonadota bacterium]
MTPQDTGRRPTGSPPVLARALLRLLVPAAEQEFFFGDMAEGRARSWVREIPGALALRLSPRAPRGGQAPRRGDGPLREVASDVRHALRGMRRSPGFTAVALVTLALGIGANAAMFSIVNGVILRPLPYPEADRIVRLWETNLSRGWSTFSIAPGNLQDWREQNRSLELLGAYRSATAVFTGGARPETLPAYRVSEDYLKILGGEPVVGRGVNAEDTADGARPVVILSNGFWQRALGGDAGALGTALLLDGVPHTVIGILPEGWRPPTGSGIDLVLPLKIEPERALSRSSHFLQALGRLRPNVTPEQSGADFGGIATALEGDNPDTNSGWGATVRPLEEVVLGSTRGPLYIFMASVGLVLLIACANLANMTLARATGRVREFTIRTALGASRGRVIRQLLAESVVLSAAGGLLGVLLGYGAVGIFVARWPSLLPRSHEITVDGDVLLFSLVLAVVSGIVFGLVPALSVTRSSLCDALRQGGRGLAGDSTRQWTRSGLVVAEVGLAVVLLIGTALLVLSFSMLLGEDPGFRTDQALVFSTPLPEARYPDAATRRLFAETLPARLAALPGVEAASVTSLVPLSERDEIWGLWVHGRGSQAPDGDASALFYRVGPGYHETLGIPVLAGRGIRRDDRANGPPVAVISASLAEELFAGEDPVGQSLLFGRDADEPLVQIVGVVGDVHHYDLGRASLPQIYVPFAQRPAEDAQFVLKAAVPPADLVEGVRAAAAEVDPDQPLEGLQTLEDLVAASVSTPRFRTLLMAVFGFMALVLAVVGLYGVVAYGVSQRTKEIGVRMALGATRTSVVGMVMRQGAPLLAGGVAVGSAGALVLSRFLESMLFGVGARDPGVFVIVPALLCAVGAAALLIPARRAARVDPVRSLGEE